jgi:hypothetical protein
MSAAAPAASAGVPHDTASLAVDMQVVHTPRTLRPHGRQVAHHVWNGL